MKAYRLMRVWPWVFVWVWATVVYLQGGETAAAMTAALAIAVVASVKQDDSK